MISALVCVSRPASKHAQGHEPVDDDDHDDEEAEEDDDDEATLFNVEVDKQKLKELRSVSGAKDIPKGMIPQDIEQQIEELPTSGLLSKPEEEKPTDSLLGRT